MHAHENCVFCSCTPEIYKSPQQALSSHFKRLHRPAKLATSYLSKDMGPDFMAHILFVDHRLSRCGL